MKYKFAVDKEDYTDFASGRVLYSAPGTTGFPVRLTSEILQRAFAILGTGGHNGPYNLRSLLRRGISAHHYRVLVPGADRAADRH